MNKNNKIAVYHYLPLYLIMISFLLFATRDYNQAKLNTIDVTNLHRIVSIPLSIFLSINSLKNLRYFKPRFPIPLRFFFGYIFLGILSAFFFSNWLGYSLWKLLEIFADFILAFYVWNMSLRFPEIIFNFYKRYILFFKVLLISVLISVLVFPNLAIKPPTLYGDAYLPYQIFGVIVVLNANSIGMISASILYISIVRYSNQVRKKLFSFNFLWILSSALFLVFAQSRTSIVAFLIAIIMFLVVSKNFSFFRKTVVILFGGFLVYFFLDSVNRYLHRGLSSEQLMNLSGRKFHWESAFETFLSSERINQFFGLGFGTGNRMILMKFDRGVSSTLHSDYLDSLISTGFLGLMFLSIMLYLVMFKVFRKIGKYRHNNYFLEFAGLLVLLIVRSFTGTTFATHNIFLILFMLITLNIYFTIHNKITHS